VKRIVLPAAAVILLVFIAGCPFTSKVPLAEPDRSGLDHQLLGEWLGLTNGGDSLRITVFPFNEREYYIETVERGQAPQRFRAFPFELNGAWFLQINELSPDGPASEYVFARYTFSGESAFTLRFVGEKIVPKELASDPVALKSFLAGHLSDPALDDAENVLSARR
jgi:hypothetical protein